MRNQQTSELLDGVPPGDPAGGAAAAAAARAGRLHATAITVAFVIAIALPLLGSLVTIARGPRDERAESQAPTPVLRPTLASLKRLPSSFAKYFEHRFGFKDSLAYLHARGMVSLLGRSPTSSVVLGDDGWLFLGAERVLEQYRPGHLFSEQELSAFAGAYEARRSWLAQRGIPYLVVLCPNSHSIYPEHLPPALRPRTAFTRTDQLIERLRTHSQVRVVDLRPALRAVAGDVRLFNRTDTHWNPFGAYTGSMAVMAALEQHFFPQLQLPAIDPRQQRRRMAPAGDLARMMALRRDYREEVIEPAGFDGKVARAEGGAFVAPELDTVRPGTLHDLRGAQPQLGSVLVFRDSFGLATMPYLSAFFERAVFQSTYAFDRDRVEQVQPDVVIQLLVERKLMTLQLKPFDK